MSGKKAEQVARCVADASLSPYGAESRGWMSFGKTVPALKQECVIAGLVQSGSKFDLVLRIVQAAKGTGSPKRR